MSDATPLRSPRLQVHTPGALWLVDYPVRYLGTRFEARMTVVRLSGGRLLLHSPCPIDAPLRAELAALGEVTCIVAPGTFHHLHVASAQRAFPDARTYVCPGLVRRRAAFPFDEVLGAAPPAAWAGELDQVNVHGAWLISEVAFLHRASGTLILVDVLENFTDATPHLGGALKLWMKRVFRMWDRPRPAPEYQLTWRRLSEARASLAAILAWDVRRIIMAHGDLIDADARRVLRHAWTPPLARPAVTEAGVA